MSLGKPKIPEPKTPAAAPAPAAIQPPAVELGGAASESDLQAQIAAKRKGRSALRIEEGRAGSKITGSTLDTTGKMGPTVLPTVTAPPKTTTTPTPVPKTPTVNLTTMKGMPGYGAPAKDVIVKTGKNTRLFNGRKQVYEQDLSSNSKNFVWKDVPDPKKKDWSSDR